ncbi:rab GTPase-binding effector protein 1 isoform X1 [Pipra filicauda]|uniref:Rab GTPase-binding effector protein 1 n=2 Tax=Pipridae TaxID=114313 RepID=A0A6J0IEN0_9PASS|nr:PREDICTED: rab GTPase-binding effector protein 1 isoform X2 [Lepidothrix coronata]XP_027520297.1 rab GTPase-binding effector protein 1 isoform X2 [Corapipo altera]XP_027546751.1 rab GTPase-binding effector protein 1 isoform X2 [Neopelma chrysocephalum]XP_027590263.1 rab GTPase-binding effector protein 1 isoform X1 [Pipra filicauda]
MAQPGPSAPADVALLQRVAELEKVNAEFLRTKQQLEQEFNQKRAKFKELYLAKEEDLKRQNAVLQAAQDDLGQLRTQLMEAHAEMENIKAIATVSETTKQEAIDEVKRQWQEEVASLQAIMKETVRDYELQYHHRLEQERAQWNQYRENVEREIAELRRRLSEGQEEENLENEMKKAQEDAEKLRSVVMPMEKEIAALKEKLGEAEEKIKELEASKVKELNHYLEAEKSCRTDLEMYVAVLNTQKSVLQEDAEKLRKELHEVCHLLEQERQQHNQLKHTWQKANDQFLESQRLLMRDMQRMEIVLTSEQLRQVEELKKKDQEEDDQQRLSKTKEEKQKDSDDETKASCSLAPEETLTQLSNEEVQVNSTHGSVHSLDADLLLSSGESFNKSDTDMFKDGLRRAQSTDSLGTSGSLQSKALGYNNKAKSAGNLDESDFGPLVGADSVSENFDTASLGSLQMPSGFMLTKDQEKAIKAMTPEQEETASLLSSVTQGVESAYVSPSGYRLVSETEWNLLQKEVQNAGNKLGRRCDMCSNYEKQLQGIQIQEAETRDQVKKLQVMLRQANDQLEKTMKEKQELEDYMKQSAEDSSNQISLLMAKCQKSENFLSELQQAFLQAKRSVQEQMAVLTQSREQVSEELVRLQKDNESLQGKHSLHVSLQQAEDFILPEAAEELRELILKYREDIISVRTAADHLEEKLKAEILFLKEQIQAEQYLKENIEETLQLEIENCKEEIASISSLKAELERIKVEKEQLESSSQENLQQLESLQEAKNILEEQLKKETAAKANLEQLVFEEKNKAQRLQTELDVSEQVQRDFVKLSQTLQVQLERIRQADSLERIRAILNDTKLTDINQLPET